MVCDFKITLKFKLSCSFLSIPLLFSGCSTPSKPTAKELRLISHPTKHTLHKVNALMPRAVKWYSDVEKSLRSKGRALTKVETKEAISLGVKMPDLIRVVVLDKFPEPDKHSSGDHFEGARAMGNIIMLKPRHKNDSTVLCHELVHIAQKDRIGGLKGFLKQYAIEREVLGYSRSLLETEAYALQHEIPAE